MNYAIVNIFVTINYQTTLNSKSDFMYSHNTFNSYYDKHLCFKWTRV